MVSHCLLNLTTPGDIATCFASSSGNAIFILAYFTIMIIVCGGWSLTLGIPKGMSIGGFLMSLIGVVGLIFGYIGIVEVMFAFMVTVIGVLIMVLEMSKGG